MKKPASTASSMRLPIATVARALIACCRSSTPSPARMVSSSVRPRRQVSHPAYVSMMASPKTPNHTWPVTTPTAR
jgi:hypothetical protein